MKLRLDNVRFSYAYVDKPREPQKAGKERQWEITAIIDEKENPEALKKAKDAIASFDGHPKFRGKRPSKNCLRRGDDTPSRAEDPALGEGKWTLSAKRKESDGPFPIVDKNKSPINARDVYSGCYGSLLVSLYAWGNDKEGPFVCGVSADLLAVVKTAEGEPLTSKVEADLDKDFADLGDSEEL